MTKAQKQATLRVIRSGDFIRWNYCFRDKVCVIGGLALAAGVEKKTLQNTNGSIWLRPYISKPILRKFGLSRENQSDLQQINDSSPNLEVRRAKMIKYVKSLSTTK
jgi:hypothetical protein